MEYLVRARRLHGLESLKEDRLGYYGTPQGKNLRDMIRNVRESVKTHCTSVLLIVAGR
ncbi:hypothetical protein [Streptomyces sp. NPDC002564]|uniref:hypothetical protein n=1 Tax=Streptomyces sp. NPDC002564 TaxID=3364649 RepID=UPI0036C605DA